MRLPLNCTVEYIGEFLSKEEAEALYENLIDVYKIDEAQLIIEAGGERIATQSYKILFVTERLRKIDSHPEHIHGKNFIWEGVMETLKERVEKRTNREYELAMCLYYPNGTSFCPYHSDQETSGNQTILPSLSLGEVREFSFREKSSQEVFSLNLENGSLLIMGEYCQSRYEHGLPKDPTCKKGRINITFREPDFK